MNRQFPGGRRAGRLAAVLLVSVGLLTACGGGGDDAPANPGGGPVLGGIPYTAGVYQPAASFAAQCASPRSGTDPSTGRAYPDRQGSVASENHWLRSWTNNLYLWYDEVADRDPSLTASTETFFDFMKTTAVLSTGQPKDRFHFTYDTAEYRALAESGVVVGYGAQWAVLASVTPRKVLIALTEPGSPAANAGLGRGAEVTAIDGVDVVNTNTTAGINTINSGLYPAAAGETHVFTIRDRGAVTTHTVTLQAAAVTTTPVQNTRVLVLGAEKVGYLLFNDHIATAEQGLVSAINTLKAGGIQDLVLDIRYNGGGYLDIASELGYMIAGPGFTAGRTFELIRFNAKHPATDPVTGRPLAPVPFHSTTQDYSLPPGQALPTLNLSRVFVLTSDGTCSASEAIINGLKGAGVTVVQIGTATCGKPYGFYPTDNCGTTYFSIQFKGVNDAGFGDYAEGFSATRSTGPAGANLPGCGTSDDFTHDLGDIAEGQLAAALQFRALGTCPAPLPSSTGGEVEVAAATWGGNLLPLLPRPEPWRENRLLRE